MGPIRHRPTRQNYDPELLENWTIVRLKEELNKRNIPFPNNARRMALVRLLRPAIEATNENSAINASVRPSIYGSARSQDSMNNNGTHNAANQDGRSQGRDQIFLDLIDSMSVTMQSLQRNVTDLTGKVNDLMNKQSEKDRSDSRSETRPPNATSAVSETNAGVNNSAVIGSPSAGNYDLTTAYAALRSANHRPSMPSAAAGSELQARSMAPSQWGFSAESLPMVEIISPTLRKNILAGMDINLASLLIPYYNGSGVNATECCEDTKSKQDVRLNRDLNLAEFVQAFTIYKNVMCSPAPFGRPERRPELDAYEKHIVDMAGKYNGQGFYEYHKRFSAEAAAHLRYNNTAVDWSIKNNTLFCNIFANLRPSPCNICSKTSHTTKFCDRVSQKSNDTKFRRFMYEDVDTYGRERVFHNEREICNNFNGHRGCTSARCRNHHICIVCKGDHAKVHCPQLSKNGVTGAQKTGAPVMRKN